MHELGILFHPPLDIGSCVAVHLQAKADIVENGHMRKNGVILEHHGNPAFTRWQMVYTPVPDPDLSDIRLVKPGNDTQQGGLATSGGPEQHHELLVTDGQVNRVQRLERAKALCNILDDDIGHRLSSCS